MAGLTKLRDIVIGLIIVIIFALIMVAIFGNGLKFFKSTTENKGSESIYFFPEHIGFYSNNNFGELPQECVKINGQDNKIECKDGTQVQFYVGIKNIGQKSRFFYAAPLLGKECEDIDDCESKEYLPSLKGCAIDKDLSKDCPTGRMYKLTTGQYRVFAGAECGEGDCIDPTNPKDSRNYNLKSFIDITVN